jgi:hypothetical protein
MGTPEYVEELLVGYLLGIVRYLHGFAMVPYTSIGGILGRTAGIADSGSIDSL